MKITTAWFLLGLALGLPVGAEERTDGARVDESPAGDAAEGGETEGGEAEKARPPYPYDTFRLYARRDTSLRLSPDAGIRLAPVTPLYSPRTADYRGSGRRWGQEAFSAVSVSFDVFGADGERDNFKAQEFRDFDNDVAIGIDAELRDAHDRVRLTGRHLGLDDRDVHLQWRRLGIAKTQVHYNRIPHHFAFDATSLYSGIGSGRLSLAPGVQETLQGTSPAEGAALLRDLVAGAGQTDIGLVRNRLGLQFELTAFDPLAVKIVVDDESREGARPFSAAFGLQSFVEIPWPVDYDSTNVRVELEWAEPTKRTVVQGSYYRSSFDNNITDVIFDNPWRATDSGVPGSFSQFGAATGQIDLYPSNDQEQFTLTAVKGQLPWKSTIQATVSWGTLEQNDPLLPFTTNTAVVPGAPGNPPFDASDPANRPADTARAELETRLVHLRWTARPSDLVSVKAHFRDYDLDNDSARIFIPGFATEDLAWRPYNGTGQGFTNLPIAYQRTDYGVELGFHPSRGTKVTVGYENETYDRDFREVEETDEDRFKVTVDTKPAPWVDLRASYITSERRADDYDFDQFFTNQGVDFLPILPFLRKFDQADRDRDRLQVIANFYPSEALIVGAHLIVGSDDYPDSRFGVLDDEHQVYAVDLSYVASERLSLFASYSFEEFEVAIRGREWFPFGPSDPFRVETGFDSASNWTAETLDEVDTVALGLEVHLIPERLRLDLSYSYSRSDGRILYASPVGTPANDLNPFEPADFPEVDDVTFYNLNPELHFTINEHISLGLAYLRESYEILDFNLDGFELVPVTPSGNFNGGLLIGALPGDYDIDVFALKLKWGIR